MLMSSRLLNTMCHHQSVFLIINIALSLVCRFKSFSGLYCTNISLKNKQERIHMTLAFLIVDDALDHKVFIQLCLFKSSFNAILIRI